MERLPYLWLGLDHLRQREGAFAPTAPIVARRIDRRQRTTPQNRHCPTTLHKRFPRGR
jgi:hypothetical protein